MTSIKPPQTLLDSFETTEKGQFSVTASGYFQAHCWLENTVGEYMQEFRKASSSGKDGALQLDASRPHIYIPTLDGWRAVAILLVIGMHCRPALLRADTSLSRALATVFMHSAYGVDIFFALSGFLICTLLLREKAAKAGIDVNAFYIRRAFRILPPILCYLSVLVLLCKLAVIPDILPAQIISTLAFVRNYFPTEGHWWYTDHFWSLAIEEHFYLVLPCVIAFLKWPKALTVMLGIAAASTIIRVVEYHYLDGAVVPIQFRTESRFDALMYGAVLAVLVERAARIANLRWWLSPKILVPVLLVAAAFVLISTSPSAKRTVTSMALPLCVVSTVLRPNSIVGRCLELRLLCWIGRLSYSLYIWQMLFLVRDDHPLGVLQRLPQALLLSFAAATISYYLVERPALRFSACLISARGKRKQLQWEHALEPVVNENTRSAVAGADGETA